VKAKDLAKQDEQDIRALLSTREGARFFARLLELCGVYRLSYVPGDTHATAFNEGKRNVGNAVMADLAGIDGYTSRLKEGMKERGIG
jgi:hypothetical protein